MSGKCKNISLFCNELLAMAGSSNLGGQLVRSGIASILIKVANSIAVFSASVILARLLGPEKYGVYTYALALVMLLMIIVTLGLSEFLVREVAGLKIKKQLSKIKNLSKFCDLVVVVLTGVVFIIAGIIYVQYESVLQKEDLYTYCIALLLVPVLAFSVLRGGAIRGYGHVVAGQLPIMLVRPVIFLLLLFFVLLFDFDFSPQVAMTLQLVAGVLSASFGIYYLRRLLSSFEAAKVNIVDVKKWLKNALPFAMISGVMVIDSNIDLIMLGWLVGYESVGIYSVGSQTVIMLVFVLSAFNMVLAPHIVQLFRAGNMKGLQKMITISNRVIAATGVPLAVILILWGDLFLMTVFGEAFITAALPLSILCIGQIVNLLMGVNGTVLSMTQYASDAAWIVAIGALINIVLNLWLIPIYGAVGAAMATSSSLVIWNVLLSWRVYHHLGVRTMTL